MKVEKYHLKSGSEFTRFEFVSEGSKGAIRKLIEFQPTNNSKVYNLAFGDFNSTNQQIDDLSVSNNGDTEKVLGTVVAALYVFLNKHPDVYVYATGSTKARTRLYRMGITKFYNQIEKDFHLYGQTGDNFVEFELGIEYDGFLVELKVL
jgi:hypothetical protein